MERLLKGYVGLVYAFMYLPILVVAVFSFNASDMIAFPLSGFTLDWYAKALSDTRLLTGFGTSLLVAVPTAIAATALGAAAALALTRYRFKRKYLFLALLVVPFFIPRIILAVSHLIVMSEVGLERNLVTVIIAQTLIILPFTVMVIASVLIRLDSRVEEAAADLGATGWQIFRRVQLPLMRNGLIAASFIAFVLSSSEYVLTNFVSGRSQPLSILVASDFRFNLSPALDALAMLIVLFNVAIVVVSEAVRMRSK
ncbi:MAG: ABC transporter permease [Mesorhizobium sp. 61-13]|nr:ABC transporter permease [Mesorhizobium sp.]OJU52845.1 MAG: ABC transporter permease [Mesorhizobium sp. 61-13]